MCHYWLVLSYHHLSVSESMRSIIETNQINKLFTFVPTSTLLQMINQIGFVVESYIYNWSSAF